ncbi:D-alanyl-D-alanine endopeptidase [Azovibrio restrictus]|uniref:D-alanyl-D-alanine endopeptidase n=1 Tax=Azovibrio restrictus TaxID=146938 RepID=UPI0026EA5C53|nr:D-alanyl-D-alanine endopeptidase [Azovibrio restrictus]MDD3482190.1 D-alanyl-D-alanine endopeptidase [Azovibrio restrictus]
MKKLTISLLVCAMIVLGSAPSVLAAEKKSTAKSAPAASKKASAKKSTSKTTAKASGKGQQRAKAGSAPAKQVSASSKSVSSRKVAALPEDWSDGRLSLASASVLVMDQVSGKPLLEKNPGTVVPIASISKLMTAMVVLDAGLNMDEVITISDQDVDYLKGTRSRLQVGSAMTRDTALLLALMSSENRAANSLGRHYPGGLQAFVAAMNRKAWSLGLTHTHFEEPTGLSVNNVSTARDLARMVMAAHQYPKIREYSTMAEARVDLGHRILDFNNTNALVKNPQWQIGLSKTGYISEAGRCLVMQAWVADKPVVMVLLDSAGKMTRVGDANRIKRWMESASAPRNTGA